MSARLKISVHTQADVVFSRVSGIFFMHIYCVRNASVKFPPDFDPFIQHLRLWNKAHFFMNLKGWILLIILVRFV